MSTNLEQIVQVEAIEKQLGYSFHEKKLIASAFIHCSYINEHRTVTVNNERLEFLGDSVLGILIADDLYNRFPEKTEGELSTLRAKLIEASSCAIYVEKLGVEKYLLLGKGEKLNQGRGRQSILADLFEAIIGAIYLDGGIAAAKDFLWDRFRDTIQELIDSPEENWKAIFQDLCQKKYQMTPVYSILQTHGPEHNKNFVAEVLVNGVSWGQGTGLSKKEAQRNAALDAINKHFSDR
ncbi:MAG: ribonuclease III [Parachlamydiales bacterium]|jgi:ribonuclease-3